jgi:putative peptidoglycan lipid II flippase
LATVAGWGAVAVASVLVALLVPARDRVPALTAANSAGMLLLAVVLVVLVGRRFGAGALAGVRRAAGTALLAGTLAAAAGIVARWPVRGTPGYAGAVLGGMLSGIAVAVVFVGVVLLVDSRDARPMLARLVRRVSAGRRGGVATTAPGGTGEPVRGGATASAGQTEPAEQTKGDR